MRFLEAFYMTVLLVTPVVCLAALGRKSSVAARIWFLAGLLQGVGVVSFNLLASDLRSMTSLGWLVAVMDFISFAGALLHISAVLLDLKRPPQFAKVVLLSLSLAGLAFQLWRIPGPYHAVFMLVFNGSFALLIAFWLMKLVKQEAQRWAGYVRLYQVLVLVRLVVMLCVALAPIANPHTGPYGEQIVVAVSLISAVVWFCANVAYLGVNIDRLHRHIVEIGRESAKQEERERLKDSMALLERQRTAGIMSSAISHELKQPLTSALTNAQVAIQLVDGVETPIRQYLGKVEDSVRRAARIIDGLQTFMRAHTAAPLLLDVRSPLNSALNLLQPELRRAGIEVRVDLGTQPLMAIADETQLCQVFVNVLRNAIQASQDAPLKRISISHLLVDGQLIVEVQDTGPGFPDEVLKATGLPFTTQRPDGLGLGLAVSQNIMTSFGGSLTLRNAEPSGATVEIALLV